MTNTRTKPWTTARLIAALLEDLNQYGFTEYDKRTIIFRNNEVRILIDVDVTAEHRDAGDTERTIYLQFWADLVECPLNPDPRGVLGLWRTAIDEYLVFNKTGTYMPYTLKADEVYNNSKIHHDLLEFGIPLLLAFSTKESFFSSLLGKPLQLGSQNVVPFYEARHFHNSIALYTAHRLGLKSIALEAAENLFAYVEESEEHMQNLKRLLAVKKDVATALHDTEPQRYKNLGLSN